MDEISAGSSNFVESMNDLGLWRIVVVFRIMLVSAICTEYYYVKYFFKNKTNPPQLFIIYKFSHSSKIEDAKQKNTHSFINQDKLINTRMISVRDFITFNFSKLNWSSSLR